MCVVSALYLDFDNIFSRIKFIYGEDVAEQFVFNINHWMNWLEKQGLTALYKKQTNRVFHKKIVYLNPIAYKTYRMYFVQEGFRVIDCPPLTKQDKTSTDMCISVDMISDLYTKQYDEFIILSGDADFSPVLFHINERSKKTLRLGIGPMSKIYANAASYCLVESEFINVLKGSHNTSVNEARILKKPSEFISVRCIKKLGFPILDKSEQYQSIFKYLFEHGGNVDLNELNALQLPLDVVNFFRYYTNNDCYKCSNVQDFTIKVMDAFFSSDLWKFRDKCLSKRQVALLMCNGLSKLSSTDIYTVSE